MSTELHQYFSAKMADTEHSRELKAIAGLNSGQKKFGH